MLFKFIKRYYIWTPAPPGGPRAEPGPQLMGPWENEGITPSIPAGFRHKPKTQASAPAESRTKAQAVTAAKMKASPSISEAVLNDESLHESPQAPPKNVRPDPPTTSKHFHKQGATILARLPLSAHEPAIAGRRAQRHSQHPLCTWHPLSSQPPPTQTAPTIIVISL